MKARPRGIARRAARARILDGRQQGEPIHDARRPAEFAKSDNRDDANEQSRPQD